MHAPNGSWARIGPDSLKLPSYGPIQGFARFASMLLARFFTQPL